MAAELHEDPFVELVRQAMASAVVSLLEDYNGWVKELSSTPQGAGVHTAFTEKAEGFVKIRADLVGAAACTLCPHPEHYDHNAER